MTTLADLPIKELKECRKVFEEYYTGRCDLTVDPRPGGQKWCKNFVNETTQTRWCAWSAGWTYRANKETAK